MCLSNTWLRTLVKQWFAKVLYLAAQRHLWEVGALVVTAYTFGLRVPSELLQQATAIKFNLSTPGRLSYGPIQRKGARELRTLTRWCICHSDRVLCPHDWIETLWHLRPTGLLFKSSLGGMMAQFHRLASDCGESAAHEFTSHCFRRGAGVDVLEAHGLKAMLSFGEWSSPHAAAPYASSDEQTARALGTALADFSDED